MPEFNNIKCELNDGEKFALVCGMLAGLKLQDKTQPPNDVTVTLEPINVGGSGRIGLMASDVHYEGNKKIRIPVVTHDVDIEYSGFTLSISYNNSRVVITSIDEGDFGHLINTSVGNGKAYTSCMLDKGKYKKEPCIVCYLNCKLIDVPTKGNPIELKFNSSSGYDPNYCTLLTWVKNDIDSKYYSYFITPTENKGCKITSDIDRPTEKPIGNRQEISYNASPSLVGMGTSYIEPGSYCAVPIYTNSNAKDNFPYSGFKLTAQIEAKWADLVGIIDIKSKGEWTLNKSNYYIDEHGNKIISIEGYREKEDIDASTVGCLVVAVDKEVIKVDCVLHNIYSELINSSGSLGVVKGDGYIYSSIYMPNYDESISIGLCNGTGGGGSGGGGFFGDGCIWSSCEQIIWVSHAGTSYPIYLKPGYNNAHAWLPNLSPSPGSSSGVPTIEATGYILIPGGFIWKTITNSDVPRPLELSSPRILDRFEIKDIYNILVEKAPVPVNLDELLDSFEILDTVKTEILDVISSNKNFKDDMELNDFADVYVKRAPVEFDRLFGEDITIDDSVTISVEEPPVYNYDDIKDRIHIDDMIELVTLNVNDDYDIQSEESEITDFINIEQVTRRVLNNDNIEENEITDFSNIEQITKGMINKASIEENEITDVTNIEKN